jgi:hypothetical protein
LFDRDSPVIVAPDPAGVMVMPKLRLVVSATAVEANRVAARAALKKAFIGSPPP